MHTMEPAQFPRIDLPFVNATALPRATLTRIRLTVMTVIGCLRYSSSQSMRTRSSAESARP